ncbi:hypothetical protein [Spirosoma gilvum]
MSKQQLNADLEKLYRYVRPIGELTYGKSSKTKYVLNDLTRKINEAITFFRGVALPDQLLETREIALSEMEAAYAAIQEEYSLQKPDSKGHEFVTSSIDSQSTIIRNALKRFDAKASACLDNS